MENADYQPHFTTSLTFDSDHSRSLIIHNLRPEQQDNEFFRYRYLMLLEALKTNGTSHVFPEVIDCWENHGDLGYSTQLKDGQKLDFYLENANPIAVPKAANFICTFIDSYLLQIENCGCELEFAIETLLVETSIYGPELVVNEIKLPDGSDVEKRQVALLLSIFRGLTQPNRSDLVFRNFLKKVHSGPQRLRSLSEALTSFAGLAPTTQFRAS